MSQVEIMEFINKNPIFALATSKIKGAQAVTWTMATNDQPKEYTALTDL